jgi:hypothetical protein
MFVQFTTVNRYASAAEKRSPGQVGAALQLTVQVREALGKVGPGGVLGRVGKGGVPQRAEALVDLGRDEGEPLLETIALERAVRRGKARLRRLVGKVLHERRDLRQDRAVVEAQRRDVAFRVHVREGLAPFRDAGSEVELVEIEREAGLAGDDMRGERAGSGGIVQLHVKPPAVGPEVRCCTG